MSVQKRPLDLSGLRVLVLGASGFIGSHVTYQADLYGAEVRGLVRPQSADGAFRRFSSLGAGSVDLFECDVSDVESLTGAMESFQPDIAVQAAGLIDRNLDRDAWSRSFAANAGTTAATISAVAGVKRAERPVVVLPGSQSEYGRAPMPWVEDRVCEPTSVYGATKLAASELVRAARRCQVLSASVVRLPIVFGPAQLTEMMVPEVISRALERARIEMTPGSQRRRLLYVDDAARVLLSVGRLLLDYAESFPDIVNSPAYQPMTIRSVADRIVSSVGHPVSINYGALDYRQDECIDCWPDTGLAESMNLYRDLTPFDEAMDETVRWYRTHPKVWSSVAVSE